MATTLQHSDQAEPDFSGDVRPIERLAPPRPSVVHGAVWFALELWRTTTAGWLARYAGHLTVLIVIVAALIIGRPARASSQTSTPEVPNVPDRAAATDGTLVET